MDLGAEAGYLYEEDNSFEEFARLLIGNTWHVISFKVYWKMNLKLRGQKALWVDNGSETGPAN